MLVWAARPETYTKLWIWVAGTGTLVFLAIPQWWFHDENDAEMQWSAWQQFVCSSCLVRSLIALIVIGLSAHQLGRADKNATGPSSVLWAPSFAHPTRPGTDPERGIQTVKEMPHLL